MSNEKHADKKLHEQTSGKRDRELGMKRGITRRDFLNGVSVAVGSSLVLPHSRWLDAFGIPRSPFTQNQSDGQAFAPEKDPAYYPPAKTGMRGSHDGSWEVAHELRDGDAASWANPSDDDEHYDLIIVGGGISGLASAYFYRKLAGAQSKILILDNHDDFGGHAKRNEFDAGNRMLLGYGGTQSIEAPGNYSKTSAALLKDLGIDTRRFYKYYDQKLFPSMQLKEALFFDKETFGMDRLLPQSGLHFFQMEFQFGNVEQFPIDAQARKDLVRLQTASVDYLPKLTPSEKRKKLVKTSYKDFLLNDVKVHPDVVKVFQASTHDVFAIGIDGVSAMECQREGFPGFKGMTLPKIKEANPELDEPYIFHFPDGNASISRLLVRSLIPEAVPGVASKSVSAKTSPSEDSAAARELPMDEIVTARVNYARLDDTASRVRIRLNSTAVNVRHVGDAATAKEVEVTYVRGGQARRVRGAQTILACYNMVIPYLCTELPEKQKAALSYAVKSPLVYTNVQIRNWRAFERLGISAVYAPGAYFSNITLDFPVSIGKYKYPSSPDESCLIHLLRVPCEPGLDCKDQFRTGRLELFNTKFDVFERNVRDELARVLGAGGFDSARDIQAITVNRWPHGYAYEYNELFEPLDRPKNERPCVAGRQPFGRIKIANSDSDGHAYTNTAIDQGYRAVREIVG
jgi:spermidine dehydrogenase